MWSTDQDATIVKYLAVGGTRWVQTNPLLDGICFYENVNV